MSTTAKDSPAEAVEQPRERNTVRDLPDLLEPGDVVEEEMEEMKKREERARLSAETVAAPE